MSLGSKLNVSKRSTGIEWWASNRENNCFVFSVAITSSFQKPSNKAIYGRFGDARLCHFSLCQINSATESALADIFVALFIYGLQMIYFSIFAANAPSGVGTESVDRSIDLIYGVWSNERVRTTKQCLTCALSWMEIASSMCAANYRRADASFFLECQCVCVCVRSDDGKSKMTKTPTQHHTMIIIIACRDL